MVRIEGRVVQSGDTLILTTERRQQIGPFRGRMRGDTLRLTADAYSGLQTKELAEGRTAALGVAVVGAVGFVLANILADVDRNSRPPPTPPDPDEAVLVGSSILGTLWRLLGAR